MGFIEQAYKGNNEWWKYILGFCIIFFFWQIIGVTPYMITVILHTSDFAEVLEALENNISTLEINRNLTLFMILLSGVFGFLSVKYVVKLLHKRSFTSVITSRQNVDWKRILFSFGLIFGIQIMSLVIMILIGSDDLQWNFKLIPFLILLIISFLLFPFQTGTEELIFRGYLLQGMGVLSNSKFTSLLLTSIIFGLMHWINPEVKALGWSVMIFYVGTGLLYGISTLMDDGMELALGMHAANNIAVSLFITASWTAVQTDALYIDHAEPSVGMEMFVPVFIIYPILLIIFSRKYQWTDWKEKLTGSV